MPESSLEIFLSFIVILYHRTCQEHGRDGLWFGIKPWWDPILAEAQDHVEFHTQTSQQLGQPSRKAWTLNQGPKCTICQTVGLESRQKNPVAAQSLAQGLIQLADLLTIEMIQDIIVLNEYYNTQWKTLFRIDSCSVVSCSNEWHWILADQLHVHTLHELSVVYTAGRQASKYLL